MIITTRNLYLHKSKDHSHRDSNWMSSDKRVLENNLCNCFINFLTVRGYGYLLLCLLRLTGADLTWFYLVFSLCCLRVPELSVNLRSTVLIHQALFHHSMEQDDARQSVPRRGML